MLSRFKLLLVAAVALTALAALVSNAQATNSFSISPGGGITATTQGKLSFGSSIATIQCSVTMRGSVRGSGLIVLSELVPIGSVNEVSISPPETCTGGKALEVTGLPWTVAFEKLRGERGELGELIKLPIAKIIKLRGSNFKVELGFQCRYGGEAVAEVLLTREGANEPRRRQLEFISGLVRADERVRLRLIEGAFCPATGFFAGRFSQTTQKIIKRIP